MKIVRKPKRYVSIRLARIKDKAGAIEECKRNKREYKIQKKSSTLSNSNRCIEELSEKNDSLRYRYREESKEDQLKEL